MTAAAPARVRNRRLRRVPAVGSQVLAVTFLRRGTRADEAGMFTDALERVYIGKRNPKEGT